MSDQTALQPDTLSTPTQQAGITSGPGNQGSANTAHMGGQAGTGAGFLSLPRTLKGPASGGGAKPQ